MVELTLVRSALKFWAFDAKVTDEFILWMAVLRTYDALVHLGLNV
jgi:hypothetical protein